MDQDLLAYLEQRFSSIDRRFQETGQNIQTLREEMTQGFGVVDQRLEGVDGHLERVDQRLEGVDGHLERVDRRLDGIDQRLDRVDQRLDRVDQRLDRVDQRLDRVDQRLDRVDQRLDRVDQRFDQADQRFDNLETDVRGAWVTIEDLRGQIKLVAEGVANNSEQLERHREEMSRRFDEVESLIHSSYDDLDVRVRRLEKAAS